MKPAMTRSLGRFRTAAIFVLAASAWAQEQATTPAPASEPQLKAAPEQKPAPAASGAKTKSVDELLDLVEKGIARDQQAQKERLTEFERRRDLQAQRLEEARRELKALEARSAALEQAFQANDAKLTAAEAHLHETMGSLRELFGVLQQVAGEFRGVIHASAISSQYPKRETFIVELIDKTSKSTVLPTIPELEKLWFEMQREMTASGKIQRYNASYVDAAGQPTSGEVVRVGTFSVISSDSKFLVPDAETGALVELAKPPGGDILESARTFQEAAPGNVESLWIDPSRGVLLTLVGQRPDLRERIHSGGEVAYIILAVGALGAIAAFYQLIYLIIVNFKVRRQLADISDPRPDNALGRVLAAFRGDITRADNDPEAVELRLSEAVMREIPALERFQSFLKLVVAAGPLLGLVGTVIGMIITFQSITEAGSSDPRLMANGISRAMVATALGLGIAIPILFINAVLMSRSKRVVQILDEQSAGMLAERLETSGRA